MHLVQTAGRRCNQTFLFCWGNFVAKPSSVRRYQHRIFSPHLRPRSMSQAPPAAFATEAEIADFQRHLASSDRILALLGAGLSAASGLPTFRGAGGMWRNHEATSLATPEAFEDDPGLVWQFYSYRRHMALHANPNPAHYALAELARKKENFITLSQNVDGLSQRANHPPSQLRLLHGNLFDIKCFNEECTYFEANNFHDPIVPALANPDAADPKPSESDKTGQEATTSLYNAMNLPANKVSPALATRVARLDPATPQTIDPSSLPRCPECKTDLLRPGVVWFGEPLPSGILEGIDAWIEAAPTIDLMLVIGTTAKVFPAASYIEFARRKGARVAVINMDPEDLGATGSLRKRDWMFCGDAGVVVPKLFEGVVGVMGEGVEAAKGDAV